MIRLRQRLLSVVSWLAVIAVAIGCLPEPLPVKNIPKVKPEIVVNTQIIPDGSLVVFLSQTIGALEASDNTDELELINLIAVKDATVNIEGPSGNYPLLPLGLGLYGGVEIPFAEGQTYHLKVHSESLGDVEATTRAMKPISFESIEVERYFNGFDDTLAQVTYTIKDPVDKNHYMINVQRISFEDPPIYERVLNPRVYTRLVNDEDFEGGEIAETFRTFWQDYETGDTTLVSLANISPEYYHYIQLRLDNRVGFLEFVSEPINYPTNVVGGRGFFNLYVPDVRFFVLD